MGPNDRRGWRAGAVALLLVAGAGAGCGGGDDGGAGATTTTAGTTTTTGAPTAPAPAADQTPPQGANGLAFGPDGTLWVADLAGGQILGVDPADGAIRHRYGAEAGVSGPDDVAFAPDGALWWSGLEAGVVGRIAAPGTDGATSEDVATVGAGVNPVTVTDDGRVFAARTVRADALYEIDPTGAEEPRLVAEDLGNLNAFALGPDGLLHAPRLGDGQTGQGAVVTIDPATGAVAVLADGLTLPVAVKVGADGTTYVLEAAPPRVSAVAPDGTVTEVAALPDGVGDNLALAPDGATYVSRFDRPLLSRIAPDGTVTTLALGRP